MNRLLIFVTMLCLSLSATQAYADSPIFVDKFKSFFSGSSENNVKAKRTSKKPLSLKTKKAKRSANNAKSSAYGSVSDRFKKAVRVRDIDRSKKQEKRMRMIQERVMLAQQNRESKQQLANQRIAAAQKKAASGDRPDRKTRTDKKAPSSKRFIVRKSKEPKIDPEKGSFPAPIFKNFR